MRCGNDLCKSQESVVHSDMSQLILVGQTWKQEFSVRKTGKGNMAADEQAKEGALAHQTIFEITFTNQEIPDLQ